MNKRLERKRVMVGVAIVITASLLFASCEEVPETATPTSQPKTVIFLAYLLDV